MGVKSEPGNTAVSTMAEAPCHLVSDGYLCESYCKGSILFLCTGAGGARQD